MELEVGKHHVGVIKLHQGQSVTIVTVAEADGEMWQSYKIEHTQDEHSTGHIVVSVIEGCTLGVSEDSPHGKWIGGGSRAYCLTTDENS